MWLQKCIPKNAMMFHMQGIILTPFYAASSSVAFLQQRFKLFAILRLHFLEGLMAPFNLQEVYHEFLSEAKADL